MKNIQRNTFFVAALVCITQFVSAQALTFTGKVLESSKKTPVEYATVIIKSLPDSVLIAGASTDEEGIFEVQSPARNVFLEISFIGFETRHFFDFKINNNSVNLSEILLKQDSQVLGEVTVTGQRSQTEFHLDKRVFNVGQDLSSSGASALEVLNNVPSVAVNIEGQISLRGSQGVRILINGKPSVLASEQGNALGSITADMIEKIEVITNPSAKYDAEGSSGIINIILKKENKEGVNGAVTVNGGIPNNHSVGFSLNRRTQKFNLFSQVGIGHRTFPRIYRTINQDSLSVINSTGKGKKNETFYNLILGADYHINKTSILSVSGHYGFEKETEFSDTYFNSSGVGMEPLSWSRHEDTKAGNPKWQYEMQYQKNFEDHKEHKLLLSSQGNYFGKDQNSVFTHLYQGDQTGFSDQNTNTDFSEREYTFKADYTKPFNDTWLLEAGGQYMLKDIANDFAISNFEGAGWVNDPALTNVFSMDQNVLAGYASGAYEGKKLGVKAGLRIEDTYLNTLLKTTTENNTQKYANLFPSVHTSYKLKEVLSFQAGYSRRIYRPGLWQLNPFYNIQNNYRIQTGNPALRPEYTDSFELTGIYNFSSFSINLGGYHRYTTDAIETISTVSDNISISKPANAGKRHTTGAELNARYAPVGWVSLMADFNYNYFTRKGEFEKTVFDFSANQMTSKLTAKLKLPAGIDFELVGHYRSGYRTIQGHVSENAFADMGLRKKLFKGKTIVNLSVRDMFASRFFESTVEQPEFYLYQHSRAGRFITLGVSYGFGKGEAMEFSGQKMF